MTVQNCSQGEGAPSTCLSKGGTALGAPSQLPRRLSDLPVEGGSAKRMGRPSKKLYKHKLSVTLLFKGPIVDSPGNSYTAERAGQGSGSLPASPVHCYGRIYGSGSQGTPGLHSGSGALKVAAASFYYLERGFQLSRRSCEQKLNGDAEWNNVAQCRTAGQVLACLEEQGPEGGRAEVVSACWSPRWRCGEGPRSSASDTTAQQHSNVTVEDA